MNSYRSRMILWMFRHGHLLRLKRKPRTRTWERMETILTFREECESGARRFGRLPPGITIESIAIGPMKAEWIIPRQAPMDQAILFAHGGGYVSGSCSDHRTHAAKFADATGLRTLLYEYRLAPEHPCPAALEDSVSAYQWLLNQGFASRNISVIGDSAGGGLGLTLLLALREKGLPLPSAAVAVSPWTDLSCSGGSYRFNAEKCLSPKGCWHAFSDHYCAGHDPRDPMVSPLFGDLEGLPPIYISAGGDEILLDDAVQFAEKARKAGVSVTLRVGEGLFHCYPVCGSLFPEAARAMREIADFVKSHVSR